MLAHAKAALGPLAVPATHPRSSASRSTSTTASWAPWPSKAR